MRRSVLVWTLRVVAVLVIALVWAAPGSTQALKRVRVTIPVPALTFYPVPSSDLLAVWQGESR